MPTIAHKAGLDPTLPDVTLEIGGKVRQLAFDFAAIVMAEKLTGLNLFETIIAFRVLSFTEIRGLLYAALLHDDPTLTLEEMDRTCGPAIVRNIQKIRDAVTEAWYGSVAKDDDAQGEAPAQAPATGA